MSAIGMLFDVIGGLGAAGGAVILLNQAYATVTTRPAPGTIVNWVEEKDGEIVRFRAQLAYTTPDGHSYTSASASRQFDSDRSAKPAGTAVTVRYNKAVPDLVTIEESFNSRWGVALTGVVIGAAALALGTLMHWDVTIWTSRPAAASRCAASVQEGHFQCRQGGDDSE